MNPIPKLTIDGFYDRFGAYLEGSTATAEAAAFEAEVEREAYERLNSDWTNGWDFDCQTEYFGGRGTSILIQNTQIAWEGVWEWLRDRTAAIPEGALINFEVHDNIRGDTMVGGSMVLRRVVTASGTFDESNEEAQQAGAQNP